MEGLILRRASLHDIQGIFEVTKQAFLNYAKMIGTDNIDALSEDYCKVKSDVIGKHVYVACIGSRVVGSLRIELNDKEKTAYLSRFGVLQEYYNLGVGKKLLNLVYAEMISMGVKKIYLHTASKASRLINFYYRQGFYIESVSYDKGYPRALLVKELF